MDFEKQTYSKWTKNKLRVVRRSIDNMKWQVTKQDKSRQDKTKQDKTRQDKTRQDMEEIHKCHNKFNVIILSTTIS